MRNLQWPPPHLKCNPKSFLNLEGAIIWLSAPTAMSFLIPLLSLRSPATLSPFPLLLSGYSHLRYLYLGFSSPWSAHDWLSYFILEPLHGHTSSYSSPYHPAYDNNAIVTAPYPALSCSLASSTAHPCIFCSFSHFLVPHWNINFMRGGFSGVFCTVVSYSIFTHER